VQKNISPNSLGRRGGQGGKGDGAGREAGSDQREAGRPRGAGNKTTRGHVKMISEASSVEHMLKTRGDTCVQ